jgi:beta-exotoxin I transport system permease protein
MSPATFAIATRLRLRLAVLAGLGMASVILMVGALFPAVGDSIGKLDVPEGVSELLGGADYGTITGWMRSEIGAVYGPLVTAAVAISAAAGSTAGEEEGGILAVVLAHPIGRSRLMLEKAGAVAAGVLIVALGTFVGLVAGVAVAGGGIGLGHEFALALHLTFFGFTCGAVALALAGATGRRAVAAGGAAGFAVLGFLVNGLAPLVDGLTWLKYSSPFYYYAGHDPLGNGVHAGDLAVLGAATAVLTALAALGFRRRDLRG